MPVSWVWTVDVREAAPELLLALETTPLTVENLTARSGSEDDLPDSMDWLRWEADGASVIVMLLGDEHGRCTLQHAPVGRVEIVRGPVPSSMEGLAGYPVVAEVVLRAGEPGRLTLP